MRWRGSIRLSVSACVLLISTSHAYTRHIAELGCFAQQAARTINTLSCAPTALAPPSTPAPGLHLSLLCIQQQRITLFMLAKSYHVHVGPRRCFQGCMRVCCVWHRFARSAHLAGWVGGVVGVGCQVQGVACVYLHLVMALSLSGAWFGWLLLAVA